MAKINETNYPRRTQANYEDTDMLILQKAGGNTFTTRLSDMREDSQRNLAPIEGSTASRNYAVGEQLVYNGILYKVTQTINASASLNVGTNITRSVIADELATLNSNLTNLINQPKLPIAWFSPAVGDNVTDISVNGGQRGKTLFVLISQQIGAGDQTYSIIGYLRCGHTGNYVTWTLIAGEFAPTRALTFSANENGKLVITQAGTASVSFVCIISNRSTL